VMALSACRAKVHTARLVGLAAAARLFQATSSFLIFAFANFVWACAMHKKITLPR
jgi:hypothetical protein